MTPAKKVKPKNKPLQLSKAAGGRKGRPPGAPNAKSAFPRDETIKIRCSQGFNKTVAEILENGSTKYKSVADVLHSALQILAARELPATYYWINKIQ